jgi:hypothetical protein
MFKKRRENKNEMCNTPRIVDTEQRKACPSDRTSRIWIYQKGVRTSLCSYQCCSVCTGFENSTVL